MHRTDATTKLNSKCMKQSFRGKEEEEQRVWFAKIDKEVKLMKDEMKEE